MIEDYNLTLLSGGYYRCDPSWNKEATGIDQCYKVYFPVSGEALLDMDTGRFKIEAGKIYFISGFRLVRQICESKMSDYWVHFVPESLYLRYLLDQLPPVCSWSRKTSGWPMRSYEEICRIFDNPFSDENRPRADIPPVLECRVQGLLLNLVSRVLERLDETATRNFNPEYYRLKPALDFMGSNYTTNPSLRDIAGRVGMAPNYFHRKFKELFGVTPFNYMLSRRLNKARHLMANTASSVKEIAEQAGYENPLYFSRVFTAQMRVTPSAYRASNLWPGRKSPPSTTRLIKGKRAGGSKKRSLRTT